MVAANVTFFERVDDALHDTQLKGALDRATDRLIGGRARALESLPESDALRDHARQIRAHTLANLDKYLGQFADSVEALGGNMYWAATADEANDYVLNLARERGVKTVVKSKSMVSEELHLNHVLEDAEVRIVETDLGEYIIQLDHDTPSHIIVPVIHKTREQIATLFRDKINASEEDLADVPHMTALARRTLRQDFLNADMGITGCNFAVAETGSVCLVMNEGNGRMSTAAPRIHVVLMGMERLVPTLEDMGVMLQLLARSATGQKLTVYSNLMTGPRRTNGSSSEPDGPDELHIVVVDNGRSQILGSELAEILYCIRCGACLNACPVYQQIGGHAYGSVYPGPIGSVVTPGLLGVENWSELPNASSLCGACREVCPVRIDIPRMLLKLRDEAVQKGKAPFGYKIGMQMFSMAATNPWMYRTGGKVGSWFMNGLAQDGWLTELPGGYGAEWTDHREFPSLARRSFMQQWKAKRG